MYIAHNNDIKSLFTWEVGVWYYSIVIKFLLGQIVIILFIYLGRNFNLQVSLQINI